MDAVMFLEKVF